MKDQASKLREMVACHMSGPWQVKGHKIVGNTCRDSAKHTIATIPTHDGFVAGTHEANARLIASAPDLLEASRKAFSELRGYYENQEDEDKTTIAILDQLQKAIAKATK